MWGEACSSPVLADCVHQIHRIVSRRPISPAPKKVRASSEGAFDRREPLMSYPDPRYLGEKGEISAMYRPADQKSDLTIGPGTAVRYLATGASTRGQFGLYR